MGQFEYEFWGRMDSLLPFVNIEFALRGEGVSVCFL